MTRATKPAAKPRSPAKSKPSPMAVSRRTPLLEWVAAGVGLILILATLGVIGAEALRADKTPPRFSIRALEVTPTTGGFLMRIEVRNTGGSPAAGVVVEGQLDAAGAESETVETTFDLVADHSSREGGLYFERDPRQGQVTLRAKSYVDP